MRTKPTIFYGALLLSGVNLLLQGVSMLFQVYLSRTIGAAGLGLLQLTLSVGALAMTLGVSGVRVTAMYLCGEAIGARRPARLRAVLRTCTRYVLALSLLSGLGLMLGARLLAARWIGDVRAAASLRILGLFLPAGCLGAMLTGYFTAAGRIRTLVAIEVAERAVEIALTVALLRFWAGGALERACSAVVLGSAAASLFSLVCLSAACLRALPPGQGGCLWREMLRLCVPLAAGGCLRAGLSTAEQMLIPRGLSRHGGSFDASMAAYGTIHGMVFPVIGFPTAFLSALVDLLIPELSQSRIRGRDARILALTDHCLRMGAIFACACAGTLHLLAGTIGAVVYRSPLAGQQIALFAPLVTVLYLDAITDGLLKGLGQQVHSVRYNTLTSALDVAGLLVLLPRLGLGGYFLSFVLTHALNFLLSIGRLLRVTGYRVPVGFCLRLGACFGACVVLTRPLPWLYLPAFCAALLATRTLTRRDLHWLRGVLQRKNVPTPLTPAPAR